MASSPRCLQKPPLIIIPLPFPAPLPYILSPASWDHLPSKPLAPKSSSQASLPGELSPRQCLILIASKDPNLLPGTTPFPGWWFGSFCKGELAKDLFALASSLTTSL